MVKNCYVKKNIISTTYLKKYLPEGTSWEKWAGSQPEKPFRGEGIIRNLPKLENTEKSSEAETHHDGFHEDKPRLGKDRCV